MYLICNNIYSKNMKFKLKIYTKTFIVYQSRVHLLKI